MVKKILIGLGILVGIMILSVIVIFALISSTDKPKGNKEEIKQCLRLLS